MKKPPPHSKNAKGDFYVEDGCCMACDMPRTEAPEFFAFDDKNHCYVCKQPTTTSDIDRILAGMEVQDLNCIQYKGRNKDIIDQLKERGLEDCISSEFTVWWASLIAKLVVR